MKLDCAVQCRVSVVWWLYCVCELFLRYHIRISLVLLKRRQKCLPLSSISPQKALRKDNVRPHILNSQCFDGRTGPQYLLVVPARGALRIKLWCRSNPSRIPQSLKFTLSISLLSSESFINNRYMIYPFKMAIIKSNFENSAIFFIQ